MMLRTHLDAHDGSEAIKSGALQKAIGAFIEKFKPEAAYYTTDNGLRSGLYVFDMKEPSLSVVIAEPFFDLGCKVTLSPCMTAEDLRAGFEATGL
ncbi:hypothetical protein EYW49_09995 [Siculibacillus lacustris]|uniref:DUF3303 domain-containing protein n=1 Tax=Siculibacillus lacustris TaxID=1549641 RepID=A0A4Q9VQZ4_9HYPH|nr:hypothetical protein [Siculibacillus lacustris]TBW38265.1 hypothetical protein EYW49_09995 [Siculibacillus lacustris]